MWCSRAQHSSGKEGSNLEMIVSVGRQSTNGYNLGGEEQSMGLLEQCEKLSLLNSEAALGLMYICCVVKSGQTS